MELTAAKTSTKVACLIREELPIGLTDKFFWTDSEVVLGYIKNETRRFHLFVANRVTTILDHTKQHQWKHIESDDNVTDDTTRGLNMASISNDHRWFKGPNLLYQPMEEIASKNKTISLPLSDPEVKVNRIYITQESEDFILRISKLTNDWQKLKRIVSLVLRFKTKKNITQIEDLVDAETRLIKLAQSQHYLEEIECLRANKPIPKSSSIIKLDPFLDENNILRVGGRLGKNLLLDHNLKHPIILTKHSKFSIMIAQHCHASLHHAGRGITINEIRSRGYWITNINSIVRTIIAKCVSCRRLRGTTTPQKMADLPSDRFKECPPFTVCGIDHFGPFIIKERRKELKRYGSLFTCLSSRAVHIEVSHSLETDSFIQALRRFIARRGNVRSLYSDNATNFVGASRELKEAISELDDERIQNYLNL